MIIIPIRYRQSYRWNVKQLILFDLTIFLTIAYVNSQNDTQTLQFANTTTTTTTTTTQCGDTRRMVDECFKDLPPHLMEFLQTTKIVINEEEISWKCSIFNRGMKCFEEYTERCLPDQQLNLFQTTVEGARNFFKKFCSDRGFQLDYLQHKDCFSHIQIDWMECTKKFQNILTEGLHSETMNITHKFMEFCCARYAYENCIYNSARYKCYTHSAVFARETARMLSDEKHFSNCRQYENALCNAGYAIGHIGNRRYHHQHHHNHEQQQHRQQLHHQYEHYSYGLWPISLHLPTTTLLPVFIVIIVKQAYR